MTRKDFQALAYAFWTSRPTAGSGPEVDQWIADRAGVMDVCARSNGRFDRDRFKAATEADSYTPAMHGR